MRLGLEVERVEEIGAGLTGPLVVGQVAGFEELAGQKKPIRWCQVDVGEERPRGIICGATNFATGDRVVVALPGAVLPGGFAITARRTYGYVSDGMICSARELGLGDDHTGILVLGECADPGADALAELELPDAVLDIAVTPDRGYCLSMRGIAREVAHSLDLPFADPVERLAVERLAVERLAVERTAAAGADPVLPPGWPVRIDDPIGCDRFTAWTLAGLDPSATTPVWMRRRLLLSGMRPISLTVDVTNYVMLELGQPMHAFDRASLTGEIVVRRAVSGEMIKTLDGVTRALDGDDLLVSDVAGPIALAGTMGGASTEIGPFTTDIVLEAAHWSPPTVMRMVRRHKLPSEAARRFERDVDSEVALPALRRAAALLAELGGATDAGLTVVGSPYPRPHIALAAGQPGRLAGRVIPPAAVMRRLTEVGCQVEGEYIFTVVPPSWRPDLADPADLVEEVLRLEGYDAIEAALPAAPAGRGLTARQRAGRAVGRALAAAGYVEVINYPFVAEQRYDDLGLPADDPRRTAMRLANPLSDQQPLLRTTLLPGLLEALARNVGRGNRDLALFETGLVFRPGPEFVPAPRVGVGGRPDPAELAALDRALPAQPRRVAVVLCGQREPTGWWGPGRPAGWADAVQAARTVAGASRVPVSVRADPHAPWHPGRSAAIFVAAGTDAERLVGHAGELHPGVIAAFDLPPRTCAMELDLELLGVGDVPVAPTVSAFPPALLDVAVVVDDAVPAGEVEAALRAGAGELLESVRLFDRYADPDRLGPGRMSLAYALRFRAVDRTLTVQEASQAAQSAVAEAARRTGAVQRA